jgi:hypothetical protein
VSVLALRAALSLGAALGPTHDEGRPMSGAGVVKRRHLPTGKSGGEGMDERHVLPLL